VHRARVMLIATAALLALPACTTRVVSDPPLDERKFVEVCVGTSSAHPTGSHITAALAGPTGAPERVVALTVPGTARWQVDAGTYTVLLDGSGAGTVTASATAQESLEMGVGCPAPTTAAP
jgi:hypothetical protein